MASNKELIQTAGELAEELGIEVATDGLNNKDLTALVKDLRAKVSDAETKTAADDAEPIEVATDGGDVYVVAEGKAITSLKGILGEGEVVKAEYLPGGNGSFESLKDSKSIVKK